MRHGSGTGPMADLRRSTRTTGGTIIIPVLSCMGVTRSGVAAATCPSVNAIPVGTDCPDTHSPHSQSQPQPVTANPHPTTSTTSVATGRTAPPTSPPSPPVTATDPSSGVSDPVTVAETMLGADTFGPYGCEDFVDAAFGRTTTSGIAHDAALSFYYSLARQGLDHHDLPIPRGALVFSTGPDGNHVDISRGDGTYVSGGVQGLSPGYGNGHNIQILPTPNLGTFTLHGWTYPPW